MRRASSAWPTVLLILCAPVWLRSSRLKSRSPRCGAGQPFGAVDRRGAADEVAQHVVILAPERRIGERLVHRALELGDRSDQHFGDEAPAERAEVAARIRLLQRSSLVARTARTNARIFSRSLRAVASRRRCARRRRTAARSRTQSPTFSGIKPPPTMTRRRRAIGFDQRPIERRSRSRRRARRRASRTAGRRSG